MRCGFHGPSRGVEEYMGLVGGGGVRGPWAWLGVEGSMGLVWGWRSQSAQWEREGSAVQG
eukprot:15443151-Alexandrium_andersonii.AAC.1